MNRSLHFEDLAPGAVFETPGATVTEAALVEFGLMWDPQPFHIDREAAGASMFEGLIASGFHTLCLSFRLFCQLGIVAGTNLGGPGMDELRWLKPVRPGDSLRVRVTVDEARPSRTKPDRGLVRWRFETLNQADEPVMTALITSLIRRRTPAAGEIEGAPSPRIPPPQL